MLKFSKTTLGYLSTKTSQNLAFLVVYPYIGTTMDTDLQIIALTEQIFHVGFPFIEL
jgi:hypothetical protein